MIATLIVGATLIFASTDQTNCPLHEQHMKAAANGDAKHGAEVDARHDTFGMAHDVSRHNFRMFADGGAIELRASDPADSNTVSVIRKHLREVAAQFAKNDFSTPAFVHGLSPDGVVKMKQLRDRIRYRYERLDAGGRIRVTTSDPEALAAIHDFMKFQVVEHHTQDSGEIEKDR
jgi:hypothetical protein